MKRLIALCLTAAAVAATGVAAEPAAPDTITASEALVLMPAQTLDILTTSMRKDLLDYYRVDSIYSVPNAMEGFSHLNRPLTRDYAQVQVTPVTRFTIRVLPYRKEQIVMTIYTIGDSLQAADSEVRFYDTSMQELKRDKFIKLASTEEFFDFTGHDKLGKKERKELMRMVPFPTVEYTVSPDGVELQAHLTVGEFLGKEVMDKITPYLRRDRVYRWSGTRFDLVK